ncbi:hypothetical protein F5141DRAFT_1213645 [Pisolithus sp. B1]|nr:hypothetical protein F5141DRAFT_1213645 [Pisolithus sp. B1]
MPKDLKDLLYPSLVACLDGPDLFSVWLPSPANENLPQPFDCLHFSWYNRHTTKGNDTPSDVHPYELHLGNSRTNMWQMLPYTSSDMAEYGQLFDRLVQAFQHVFLWIGSALQVHLPETEYSALVQVAESLPGNVILVLKEQGLVLELQNGDFAVFCSSKATHFNLDYAGVQATFVMQTDIGFDKWTAEQNGWGHSSYFC